MKKIAKYGAILSASIILMTGCSTLNTSQPTKESVKKISNWEGTYFGTVPCASCPGIKTWVKLSKDNNTPKYSIVEEYLEEKDGIFVTDGHIEESVGNFLTLKENSGIRTILAGKDFIAFVGEDKRLNSMYSLQKVDEFTIGEKTLYVNPKSVKLNEPFVLFDGVINFHKSKKSLQGTFKLDCEKEKYKVLRGKLHQQSYALGDGQEVYENSKALKELVNGDILKEASKKYCVQ